MPAGREPSKVAPATTDPTDPNEDAEAKFDRFSELLTRVVSTPSPSAEQPEDPADDPEPS